MYIHVEIYWIIEMYLGAGGFTGKVYIYFLLRAIINADKKGGSIKRIYRESQKHET